MDSQSRQTLIDLLRQQRVAALGTLRDGGPLVSQVLFAAAPDFAAFYIHISRLAQHTHDILQDPRVSLMINQPDTGALDPQQLARVSIRGEAMIILPEAADYEEVRAVYLSKSPQAAFNFGLGDFALYRIEPRSARYVAGFAKAFNLRQSSFLELASDG
jgi:hypothetical protein